MTNEPYTGAYFTIRYNDMKARTPVCFAKALSDLKDAGLVTSATHPVFFALEGTLVKRAELEYGFREINAETPDMWLNSCSRVLMEIAEKYEPAFKREADEDFDASMISDGKTRSTYGSTLENRFQDTPFGELSESSDYTTSQTHAKRGGSDSVEVQNGSDAEKLARLRDKWETTMNAVVKELNVLFMHTISLDVVL